MNVLLASLPVTHLYYVDSVRNTGQCVTYCLSTPEYEKIRYADFATILNAIF